MLRELMLPHRWWVLLLVAFAGKFLLLVALLLEHGVTLNDKWYFVGGDAFGYTGPIDSFLNGNGYRPDHRMPGYGAPYLLLRLLMEPDAVFQTLVFLQLFASALSVVLLAKLAYLLTEDIRAFRWTFWLAVVATYASFYDRQIITESFSVLALTLSAYTSAKCFKVPNRYLPLLAGAAVTWLIFMKPVYLPALLLMAMALLLQRNVPLSRKMARVLLLSIPFVLVDGAWCVRNALAHHEFRPLTDSATYPDLRVSIRYPLMRLMKAYGTSFIWWDPSAEIRLFNIRPEQEVDAPAPHQQPRLPDYVYTTSCPQDTLDLIATDVETYQHTFDPEEKDKLLNRVTQRCDSCIGSFQAERPFHYHVTARLRMLKKFLVHSGTTALMGKPFAELDVAHKAVRAFYSLLYLGAMLPGTLWAVRSLLRWNAGPGLRIVSALLLYGVFIFPFGVRMTEYRYSTSFYPLALLLTVLLCLSIRDRIRSRTHVHATSS